MSGLISTEQISFILVFAEGLLSFFSPCVIPLIPIYMSYLAGNAKQTTEDGTITYIRKKVFFHTLFFVFGISFAFFILGMSFTALGTFFRSHQLMFTRIGGILIILLGLIQIGFLDIKFLQRERKFQLKLEGDKMNPGVAFLMGFTFSFAWTPCVGPALSSVLIFASGSGSSFMGNLLVFVYTIGFVIPFLLLGLFTTQVLNFLKRKKNLLKYTVKAGGLLLILIGIMTFTGWMNGFSSYLNQFVPQSSPGTNYTVPQASVSPTSPLENAENSKDEVAEVPKPTARPNEEAANTIETTPKPDDKAAGTTDATQEPDDKTAGTTDATPKPDDKASGTTKATPKPDEDVSENSSDDVSSERIQAFDFTLVDQYGKEHTLSDYKGKVVFLNFWATWCPPCREEMPDIEALYQDNGKNEGDVIILGVANPVSEEYPDNSDVTKEKVIAFLEENSYTFPVVFDETGELLNDYNISAFPTTFLIAKDGSIFGFAPGMLTRDIMDSAIQQTIDSTK